MKIYKYGMLVTIREIIKVLDNALKTTDKNKKAQYIGEAYGMAEAIHYLIDDEDEDEELI